MASLQPGLWWEKQTHYWNQRGHDQPQALAGGWSSRYAALKDGELVMGDPSYSVRSWCHAGFLGLVSLCPSAGGRSVLPHATSQEPWKSGALESVLQILTPPSSF